RSRPIQSMRGVRAFVVNDDLVSNVLAQQLVFSRLWCHASALSCAPAGARGPDDSDVVVTRGGVGGTLVASIAASTAAAGDSASPRGPSNKTARSTARASVFSTGPGATRARTASARSAISAAAGPPSRGCQCDPASYRVATTQPIGSGFDAAARPAAG